MKRNRGFTLVEVMVVVSIILVLAALSGAAYLGVRSSAVQTVCRENLHQIGLATQLYTSNHDGLIPIENPGGRRVSSTKIVGDVLAPYGMTSPQYRCAERLKTPAMEGLASDYLFRYHLDMTLPPSNAKDYAISPEPTTVIAWDWNHGVKTQLEEAKNILFLRWDGSIGHVAFTALKKRYPNADGTWGDVQTLPGPDYQFEFPGESWPPGLTPIE